MTRGLIVGVLLSAPGAWSQAQSGTLRGLVVAEDGSRIGNAVVVYRRSVRRVVIGNQLQAAPGEAVVGSAASADASGAFNIGNLPAGTYGVCAHATGSSSYLDSCKWSSAIAVTIAAGTVTQQTLVLKKGVFLRVHVNDNAGFLPAPASGPLAEPGLVVGVIFGNGAYLGAVNTNVDAHGRDYEMPVPSGVPLKLWIFSRQVALTDSLGAPLAGGAPVAGTTALSGATPGIPFTASPGQDQAFTLNVSGHAVPSP